MARPPLARALELYLCPISSKMALVGFAGGSVLADLLFNDGLRAFSGAGVLGAVGDARVRLGYVLCDVVAKFLPASIYVSLAVDP